MLAFVLLAYSVYKLCSAFEATWVASEESVASHHTTTTIPATLGHVSPLAYAAPIAPTAAATADIVDTVSPVITIPATYTPPATPACPGADITDFLPATNSTDPTLSPPAIITTPPTVAPDTAAWDAFVASASEVTDWTIDDEDDDENEMTVPTNTNCITVLGQTLFLELETVVEEDEEEEIPTPILSPSSSLVSIPEQDEIMNFFDFNFEAERMDTCTGSRDEDELEVAELLATMSEDPCDRSIEREVEVSEVLTTFDVSDVRTAESPSSQPSTSPRLFRPLPRRSNGPAPWLSELRSQPPTKPMRSTFDEEEFCSTFEKLYIRTE